MSSTIWYPYRYETNCQDNQEISIAQSKFNSTSSNVQAIPSGKTKVPGASAVANPTTLILGSALKPSNIPNGETPTGPGGAIGTGTTGGGGPSSGAQGLYDLLTGVMFALSSCICVMFGVWMIL
jgi:hypothetical protein